MSTHKWMAVLLTLSGMLAGCASASKLPVFGTWRIASYSSPGLSAQSPVQLLAWVGESASFGPDDARFGGDRCSAPTYTARPLSAAEFQQEYKAPPAKLGLTGDPVTVYRLDCGYTWGAKTNTLIVKSPTSLLVPWDGTFFELVKHTPALK
jgi:hypothetical protein